MKRANRGTEDFPARPTLTPVFVCSVSFWALCALGFSAMRVLTPHDGYLLLIPAAVACITGLVLCTSASKRFFGLIVIAACTGFCLGIAQGIHIHLFASELQSFSGTVALEVLEDSSNGGYGESAQARALFPGGSTAVVDARFGDVEPLLAGQRYTCRASFSSYDYEQRPIAWSDGSCGSLKVLSSEQASGNPLAEFFISFRKRALDALGNETDAQRLLQALVCGYRHDIRDSELYSAFQTCGLAHLVAVSGAHLVIVTGFFAEVLRWLRVPKYLTVSVLIAAMMSYYLVSGMPVSALRATIMTALGLCSFVGKRRASSLNAVGVGIIGIVLSYPPTCVSASFSLSGLSTIGIVLFAPLVRAWLARTIVENVPFAADALSLTLSAGVLSQLYAASLFNQIPLIAPLSNVVATPLFPLVCASGLATVLIAEALPPLAPLVQALSRGLALAISSLADTLANVPYAAIPAFIPALAAMAASSMAAIALWVLWPRSKRAVVMFVTICLATVFAFALPLNFTDRIVMLDVGQGDAILVQSRGQKLLIDTGNEDGKLLAQLAKNGVLHLDAVLITHADDDHCGSLDALKKAVQVDSVLLAAGMEQCDDSSVKELLSSAYEITQHVGYLEDGDEFYVGAYRSRVVWPKSFSDNGGNADSLCLLLEYDGNDDGTTDYTAFMTGDAEKAEVRTMIKDGRVGHVDLLKVGHHGSANGATKDQMGILSPAVALISCGKYNRYGHPAPETLAMLESVGAQTFRTDENGAITNLMSPTSIRVVCER